MARVRLISFASVILAAVAFDAAAGEIFRCVTPKGVSYQELPCDAGSAERSVRMGEFPPANVAERDRLLQREAELDARMLKRAEIDAAERIAREARWAREAELEAERQRAKAAESQFFYPAYPVYGGLPARPRPYYRPGQSVVRY